MSWGIWIIIGIILLIIEFFTMGFVAIFFAIAAIATGIVSIFTDSISIQLLVFCLTSLITAAFGRPVLKKFFKIDEESQPSNVHAMVNKNGVVVKDITKSQYGQVKVNGDTWTAVSSDGSELLEGTEVNVLAVDGVKLVVKQKNNW